MAGMLGLLSATSVTRERRQDDAIKCGWKMKQDLCQHVKHLKSALLSLPATGEKGFEGLIGEALQEITGVPYRLARSGSQFGIDGKAAYESDAICFEGKLYKGEPDRNDVIAKIAEAEHEHLDTDMWVLGTTAHLGTQLTDLARGLGTDKGIYVLMLDWSGAGLTPLAAALAMGGERVRDFLRSHISDASKLRDAETALEAIQRSADFFSHADRIRVECDAASVGLALARKENTALLSGVFSSRAEAKRQFGQPLAPGDGNNVTIRQRRALIEQIQSYITATPDKTVAFVLGEEGCGKSWAVVQSWLDLEPKPVMLLLTPIDLPDASQRLDVDDLLIKNLIRQTGERDTSPAVERRWSRRLKQWRSSPATDGSRIIVVLDGINQRPVPKWARIIELIADEVFKLGGCLIVTDRNDDFRYRVEPRLDPSMSIEKITVPAWTEPERNEILEISGVRPASLHHYVLAQLLNPRLLGIALELLRANEITTLEELTVSRLLFEHIRNSERDSFQQPLASETARTLQECAQDFLSRAKNGQRHDLTVRDDIQAVADGRFFRMVDGDPNRIVLRDEGIVLALGFLVIEQLRDASRNDQDLGDKVNEIFEPLASLDNMAGVVFAALTVASVDTRFGPDEIVTALIEGFVALQNVSQANFPAFADLAKRRLKSFMDAAQAICLSGRYQPNFDWLQEALIEAGRDGQYWPSMIDRIHSWLSFYSLSPERGILRLHMPDQQQKVQDQIEKNRTAIDLKVQSLSVSEKAILGTMTEAEGDLSRLSQLALQLLAGKALAPFARSLMRFRFAAALSYDHATPYKEFSHLVGLNRTDWLQTREALLRETASLRSADVSDTGKWTLVGILRATGHSDDGEEAVALVEVLSAGRPRHEGWRRIETYCASDPCDPASEKPENVRQTAKQYGEIDVTKVSVAMGPTIEESFFDMARPGVARFESKAAIAKHRDLIADVLGRNGFPLRQGLFGLRRHAVLLMTEDAQELVDRRRRLNNTPAIAGLSKEDAWIVSQYHLLLAFPFLSAQDQAATLLAGDQDERFLLDLFRIAKPLNEEELEGLLEAACDESDERRQSLLLQLVCHAFTPLSAGVRTCVATLSRSVSGEVRTFALAAIAQSGDDGLLAEVAQSEWTATGTEPKGYYETWFGSIALLAAATQGLLAHEKAVDRLSTRLYGRAAVMLDADAVCEIARRVDMSITHVADLGGDVVAPDIELQVDSSSPCEPNQFTVNERVSEDENLAQGMYRGLNDEEFGQSQSRAHDAFLKFEANLTQAGARIILDNLSLEGFVAVVAAAPDLAEQWYELFMNIDDNKLPAVHNLVLWLAHALAETDPERAKRLFARVKGRTPFVQLTYGRAGVQLDAMAIWSGNRNPLLDDLRFARLDRAHTDHDLSLEVLAALLNDQQELLISYIEAKLSKQEPAEVARGIMVAGFSDQSESNSSVLARYEGRAGLVGDAQKAAKYAYERNAWSRYWFEMMCQTDDRQDFWRHSVLFSRIVDGRFDAWRSDYAQSGDPIQLFGFSLDDAVKKRIERWKAHRSKTLFGLDAPAPIFLRGANTGT